jgi:hypothetical protein
MRRYPAYLQPCRRRMCRRLSKLHTTHDTALTCRYALGLEEVEEGRRARRGEERGGVEREDG